MISRHPSARLFSVCGLGLLSSLCAAPSSLVAQSPGLRVLGAIGNDWHAPVGIGAFVDLDATPRVDLRLSLDASRGSGRHVTDCECVYGPLPSPASGDVGTVANEVFGRPEEAIAVRREIVAAGVALAILVNEHPGRQWRLVPAVQVSRFSGTEQFTQLGMELGVESRLTPASTGRFEWVANAAAGLADRITGYQSAATDDHWGPAYLRVSLGLRFRLSMKEFSGTP